MLQVFERLNTTAQKIVSFMFICSLFFLMLVAQFFLSFVEKITAQPQVQVQESANWVKPITTQEEKQEVKSFWSLKLTFEKGGNDE